MTKRWRRKIKCGNKKEKDESEKVDGWREDRQREGFWRVFFCCLSVDYNNNRIIFCKHSPLRRNSREAIWRNNKYIWGFLSEVFLKSTVDLQITQLVERSEIGGEGGLRSHPFPSSCAVIVIPDTLWSAINQNGGIKWTRREAIKIISLWMGERKHDGRLLGKWTNGFRVDWRGGGEEYPLAALHLSRESSRGRSPVSLTTWRFY